MLYVHFIFWSGLLLLRCFHYNILASQVNVSCCQFHEPHRFLQLYVLTGWFPSCIELTCSQVYRCLDSDSYYSAAIIYLNEISIWLKWSLLSLYLRIWSDKWKRNFIWSSQLSSCPTFNQDQELSMPKVTTKLSSYNIFFLHFKQILTLSF